MDDFPRMLYRLPGIEPMHGGKFATLIVGDAETMEAAQADGWQIGTEEAKAAFAAASAPKDEAPPTRAELEQKAAELGIKVDGRWSDRKLSDTIAAALES